MLFDSLAPARLTLRANLWLLYLKGPAFSIVVKSYHQVIQEEGVPLEIAGGKAAGFGGEAVGPCEACALHPGWGVGFGAGIDIEGEAYCEKNAAGEEGLEALDEFLLFWRAEAYPDEVGATGNDCFKNTRLLLVREIAVLRANDIQEWIFFEQAFAEFFSAFWAAPEEVVREFGRAAGEEFSQEGGAVDAVLQGGALAVQAPDEGHSIGDEEVDSGCGGSECGVVPPHGDDVGI